MTQSATNQCLRVAVAVDAFPKISETFILNHIIGLLDDGHEVDIISRRVPTVEKVHQEVRDRNLQDKIHFIRPLPSRIRYGAFQLLECLRVAPTDTIRALDIRKDGIQALSLRTLSMAYPLIVNDTDILHIHFGPVANDFKRLVRLNSCPPMIVSFHGWGLRRGEKKGNDHYNELFESVSAIISNSNESTERLYDLGAPGSKVHTVPIGVNTELFCPKETDNNSEIIVTTVGRLSPEKGHRDGIKAIRHLLTLTETPVRYRIIGGGDLYTELEQFAKELGVADHVCLLGSQDRQQVINHLQQTDIFLLPSHDEGLGVASLEAQACGVPVVVTDVGGLPETIINHQSGLLVAPKSPEEIAKALIELVQSPDKRKAMGEVAREFIISNYSYQSMIERLIRIYHEVLADYDSESSEHPRA